jgi:hypothetical protein
MAEEPLIFVREARFAAAHDDCESFQLLGDLMLHPGEETDVVRIASGTSPLAIRSAVFSVFRAPATIALTPSITFSAITLPLGKHRVPNDGQRPMPARSTASTMATAIPKSASF